VSVGLLIGSLASASFHAYIYRYDGEAGECVERPQTMAVTVYMWTTELLFNLVAPLTTIVLNVRVIRTLLRCRRDRGLLPVLVERIKANRISKSLVTVWISSSAPDLLLIQ